MQGGRTQQVLPVPVGPAGETRPGREHGGLRPGEGLALLSQHTSLSPAREHAGMAGLTGPACGAAEDTTCSGKETPTNQKAASWDKRCLASVCMCECFCAFACFCVRM